MENNREKVLSQLAKTWGVLPKQENEFTAKEIAKEINSIGRDGGETHVLRRLKKGVENGFLQERTIKAHERGGHQKAYSPVEGKTWEDVLQYLQDK